MPRVLPQKWYTLKERSATITTTWCHRCSPVKALAVQKRVTDQCAGVISQGCTTDQHDESIRQVGMGVYIATETVHELHLRTTHNIISPCLLSDTYHNNSVFAPSYIVIVGVLHNVGQWYSSHGVFVHVNGVWLALICNTSSATCSRSLPRVNVKVIHPRTSDIPMANSTTVLTVRLLVKPMVERTSWTLNHIRSGSPHVTSTVNRRPDESK